jgi:hypothetical protein
MCCLNALLRRNFPVDVFLKRLAAPRCVFSLGIGLILEAISHQLSAISSFGSS